MKRLTIFLLFVVAFLDVFPGIGTGIPDNVQWKDPMVVGKVRNWTVKMEPS